MSGQSEGANGLRTVKYIEDMPAELRNMSQRAHQPTLSYLIEIAMAEAADIAAGRDSSHDRRSSSPSGKTAGVFKDRSPK